MPKRALGHLKNLEKWAISITKKTLIEKTKKEQDLTLKKQICQWLMLFKLRL
jgi:hypothetical protein